MQKYSVTVINYFLKYQVTELDTLRNN